MSDRLSVGDLAIAARLVTTLPGFLRSPLDLATARRMLAERLERRESAFIEHVRHAVYDAPASPYRELLRWAGCEHGDLAHLVRREGVEGALRALCRAGVYLTVAEFKGRQPVSRGGATFAFDPGRLRNPRAHGQVLARSSGSRGPGTPVAFDLAFVRDCAAHTLLFLDARRPGARWRHADWEVPGGASVFRLLKVASFGPPARWFTQVDPADGALHPRYRWSTRLLRSISALSGKPLSRPEHVSVDHPEPVGRWMRACLDAGATPHVLTFASSAVRVCQWALDTGVDLGGAHITLMGEPVTAARMEIVRRAGPLGLPRYGTAEIGPVGYGCLSPSGPDDVHVMHDLQAVIQPDASLSGLDARSLLITTLHPAAPFALINVSMGDVGHLSARACGCPLERQGWSTHVDTIRSYEKLTVGGMNFLDVDVVRVLEEVLPARFGGTPTDYQLIERADDGRAGLVLLVHPRLGPLDPAAIAGAFVEGVGVGTTAERVGGLAWKAAGVVRVERRAPVTTRAGKILHLHPEIAAAPTVPGS